MLNQIYVAECFNLDESYPQEMTFGKVEPIVVSSSDVETDFFDLVSTQNRNLLSQSVTISEEPSEIFQVENIEKKSEEKGPM